MITAAQPSLDSACNELIGACDALFDAFPGPIEWLNPELCYQEGGSDGLELRWLITQLSRAISDLQAGVPMGRWIDAQIKRAPRDWKRAEAVLIRKYYIRPVAAMVGKSSRWYQAQLLRPSRHNQQREAVEWFERACQMFSNAEGIK